MDETTSPESRQIVNMALGRLFSIMSRPFREGDIEQFERVRAVVVSELGEERVEPVHCWARDRLRGAQGQD